MHEIKLDPLPIVTGDPDELVPIGHADRDTAAGVADEIPYNYIAADAVA